MTPQNVDEIAVNAKALMEQNDYLITIQNYCCPLKLKMAKISNPKPCKFGLRAYSFIK